MKVFCEHCGATDDEKYGGRHDDCEEAFEHGVATAVKHLLKQAVHHQAPLLNTMADEIAAALRKHVESFTPSYDQAQIGRVLEVGVQSGGSLLLWCHLWPTIERVVGIDLVPPSGPLNSRIQFFQADQNDTMRVDAIANDTGPFELVVDDASHIGEASWTTFRALWPHVKPGGIYAVEDWGTGYWNHWPDGVGYAPTQPPGHVAGMVGMIKRLVDELDHGAMSRLEILPGLAFAYKAP
jgi:demethylmacrocin O-methyltransferase